MSVEQIRRLKVLNKGEPAKSPLVAAVLARETGNLHLAEAARGKT